MSASRLFFALWPDEPTRHALVHAQRALRHVAGRPLNPHDLHITLAFLGQVDEARLACVEAAAEAISCTPFSLELDRRGAWPGPRVAWLAPSSVPPDLAGLVDALWQGLAGCGFTREARPFSPHVTLLRKAGQLPDTELTTAIPWVAESFVLAESVSGPAVPRYRIRRRWPLQPPDD